jgi:transcriptional antiterminator NusG
MSKRWYAVQAFSGYEKIVQKSLLDRVEQSGHEDLFGDILVPVEEVVEMKSGKKNNYRAKIISWVCSRSKGHE